MAFDTSASFFFFAALLLCPVFSEVQEKICPFESIYQFGDSLSDTGNLIRRGRSASRSPSSRPPYGITHFHKPTGRCSDGMLIIDFITKALQLPLLNPYLAKNRKNVSFTHGADFAVAGSTALDTSFFTARNIHLPPFNTPIRAQVEWFRNHLRSLCHGSSECAIKKLRRSLIMMGEIGGNDYNNAFFQGKTIEEIRTNVPHVVNSIVNAAREVIRLGAVRVVVPGNLPIGCMPVYLTSFATSDPGAYGELGCLKYLNQFAQYHNNHLQEALAGLRREFPEAVILYSDYYGALQSVFLRAPSLGFDRASLLRSCCGGGGGRYNYDGRRMCGAAGATVCDDPERYIHWDGIHLTQKAYQHMSEVIINGILSRIQCIW